MYPNSARYAKNTNNYEQEYTNERDIQFPEERSSVETVTELEETAINKNNVWINIVYFGNLNACVRVRVWVELWCKQVSAKSDNF